jgi:hypothetical protein
MTVTIEDTAVIPPGSLITGDGQMQWTGLLLGPGTPYQIDRQGVTGWADLPGLDATDADRPTAHGAWPGARWAQPRTVGATVWLLPDGYGDSAGLLDAFVRATAAEDTEQWLAVRLHGRTTAVRARVKQRAIPTDGIYATGGVAKASVQWIATDPRRYDPVQRSVSFGLPQRGTGLTYPLAYPLSYGSASGGGSALAANDGNAATYPQVVFTGPVTRPLLINQTTGRSLEYDLPLAAQDQLVIDTAEGTVLLGGQTSRLHTATASSSSEQLFVLAPGENRLEFRGLDGTSAADVQVTWRSASL